MTDPSDFDRFLDRLWSDLDRGELPPLATYQAEWPQLSERIRTEYDAVTNTGSEPPPARASRRHIGRYEVVGRIGKGGMAEVLRAKDPVMNRDVAIKVQQFYAQLDPAHRARFRREAQLLAQLDHPGICRVLDCVVDDDDAFLVLPLLEGGTLFERIRAARARRSEDPSAQHWVCDGDGPLDSNVDTATSSNGHDARGLLRVVERIAEAVHHAHESGVVHRDLKPENVLMTRDGPVVIDFGLAAPAEVGDAERPTLAGDRIGTLPYMAPEQVAGRTVEIDRRTDVYAIGVILYELLTLELPFRAKSAEVLAARIARGEPKPPRRINPLVSRDLEAVCARAMHAEPAKRYATALALAEDLRNVRRLLPTRARPVSWVGRSLRRVRRRPALASLTAVALALGFGAVFFASRDSARKARAEIVLKVLDGEALTAAEVKMAGVPFDKLRSLPLDDRRAVADAIRPLTRTPSAGGYGPIHPVDVLLLGAPTLRFRVPYDETVALDYLVTVRGPDRSAQELTAKQPPNGKEALTVAMQRSLPPGAYSWRIELRESDLSLQELTGATMEAEFRVVTREEIEDRIAARPRSKITELEAWLELRALLEARCPEVATERLREDCTGEFGKHPEVTARYAAWAAHLLGKAIPR